LIARYEAPEGIHVENANMRDHAPPLEQKVLFAGRNNKECKQFFGLLVQRKYDVGLSINGTMITVSLANLQACSIPAYSNTCDLALSGA
jgi:hypothetical protein